MIPVEEIAGLVRARARGRDRLLVAIAGPPGAGKSTISSPLAAELGAEAAVMPMDGFHYDDVLLRARGLLVRKGAPETFDFDGLEVALGRLKSGGRDVAIPIFDREIEISRAGAAIVPAETRIVIVEGNYLLLSLDPWARLAPLFDVSIYLDVPADELERRLLARWLSYGHDRASALAKARANDLPNARLVADHRRPADLVVRNA